MPTPGSLDATDLRHVDVGVVVWSRSRGHEGVFDDGTQIDPVGGLVVDVTEMVDVETGEMTRAYVVVDTWRGRVRLRRLSEADVDRSTMEAAAPGQIARAVRQLCEEVALDGRRRLRSGVFVAEHATLVAYAQRLVGLLWSSAA